MTVIIQLDL